MNTEKITDLPDVLTGEKRHSISRAPILVEGDVATDIEEVRTFKANKIRLFSKRHFLFFLRMSNKTLFPHIFFPSYTLKIARIRIQFHKKFSI